MTSYFYNKHIASTSSQAFFEDVADRKQGLSVGKMPLIATNSKRIHTIIKFSKALQMNIFFQLITYEKLSTTNSFQVSPDQQRAWLVGNSTQNKILIENLKKGKSKKQLRSYCNPIQQKLQIYFLIKNADLFEKLVADRRNLQINVLISKAIKTRNKRQCHSHHQKMMQRHKSIKRLSNQHYLTSTTDCNNQQSAKNTRPTKTMLKYGRCCVTQVYIRQASH